jgi:hypothetical protein
VAGTGIDKIIDTLLAQTEEYQKLMISAPTPGADGQPMNKESNQMKKFWRIVTETRPLKYDAKRQDVSKEFTIFVIEYNIGILDQNVFQTSAPPLTIEAQKRRLMTYVKNSILRKQYNYIFTGLNDQIIDFDVTINNAYANAQSRFGGIYLNPALPDKGTVTQNTAEEERAVTESLAKAISYQNNARATTASETQAALEDARKKINTSKLPDNIKQRYITLLEQAAPESRANFTSAVQSAGGIDVDGQLSRVSLQAKNLATPVTDKMTLKQYNFISDIDIRSKNTTESYDRFIEYSRGKLRPIARIETMQDRQIGPSIESSSNTGIQKLSSMFSVALHSGLDASFQRIKMTIKGDPYWLFPQPILNNNEKLFNSQKPPAEAINWIKNAHFNISDSVNIYGTDNFMLVRFRTPRTYGGSGTENNTDVETLSGIYKVVEIISNFESGKFTQQLISILDPELDILSISDQIEELSARPDRPADAGQLRQGSRVPNTAISDSRIPGPGI